MSKNWYKPDKLGRELDLFMSSKVSSRNEINTGFRQNKFFKSGVDRKGLKEVSEKDSNAVFAINQEKGRTSVFLSSMKCFVKDSFGEKRKLRGLLDVGCESRDIALKRLNALWTRLIRDPQYLKFYKDFIHEYEQLGQVKEFVAENDNLEIAYYMPRHGIFRPEKSTTKLRVVFNATNPTSNGLSLNSIQYNGELVQNYLFTIMIKFREHPYAFTADVKMMYRMILIHESQQPLLKTLWKESPEDPVKTFEMKTVTYGTVSAPFLATRTLLQLSRDEEKNFPLAAPVLR
ncbi:integrase catalytic domain-containing protein [Trichonephila clavipes]|nr:integrase catalytic domain-containing protein [Trichonephila clavipes]